MEIEKIHVLNGSNVLSTNSKKLIQMRLNIGNLESKPTNKIDGFSDRLKTLMPSLYSHKSAEGTIGGFFQTVDNGISIAQVIEHIALELQNLAGMETDFSSTVETDVLGVYNLVLSYADEDAGMYAALASVEIVEALIKGKPYFIRHDIDRLKCLYEQSKASVETVKQTANVPYFKLNNQPIKWAYSTNQYNIRLDIPLSQVI